MNTKRLIPAALLLALSAAPGCVLPQRPDDDGAQIRRIVREEVKRALGQAYRVADLIPLLMERWIPLRPIRIF